MRRAPFFKISPSENMRLPEAEYDLDTCEARGCTEVGVAHDEDGRYLCEDHLIDSMTEMVQKEMHHDAEDD